MNIFSLFFSILLFFRHIISTLSFRRRRSRCRRCPSRIGSRRRPELISLLWRHKLQLFYFFIFDLVFFFIFNRNILVKCDHTIDVGRSVWKGRHFCVHNNRLTFSILNTHLTLLKIFFLSSKTLSRLISTLFHTLFKWNNCLFSLIFRHS